MVESNTTTLDKPGAAPELKPAPSATPAVDMAAATVAAVATDAKTFKKDAPPFNAQPIAEAVIAPLPNTTAATTKPEQPENTKDLAVGASSDRSSVKSSALVPNKTASRKNVNAEVNIGGKWQRATIVDAEGEYLYKIHLAGVKEDQWFARSQVRNIDTSAMDVAVVAKAATPKSANCSFTAPAPAVVESANFSDRVAKRKIYESYTSQAGRLGRVGVTFLAFQREAAFINMVSVSAKNELEYRYAAAPAGAMVYPVKVRYVLCEEREKITSSKVVNAQYSCFRNKEGVWACVNDL